MLHDLFYRAILPDPVRVLGVTLRPFSLGHSIWFHRLSLPLLDGRPAGFRDLIKGIIVCSCKFEEVAEVLDDPDFDKTQRKWMRKTRKASIAEANTLFVEYLSKGTAIPPFAFEDRGGAAVIPFEQTVRAFLHTRTNLTDSEILNRPYALSVWDYLTIKDMDGRVEIYNKDDDDSLRKLAEELAPQLEAMHNGRSS